MPNQPNDYPDSTPLDQTQTDIDKWAARVDAMRKENNNRFEEFAARGTPVDPLAISHARLQALCDALMGVNTPTRLQFEEKLQNMYRNVLDGLESEARKAKLTAPLQQPNGNRLIIP